MKRLSRWWILCQRQNPAPSCQSSFRTLVPVRVEVHGGPRLWLSQLNVSAQLVSRPDVQDMYTRLLSASLDIDSELQHVSSSMTECKKATLMSQSPMSPSYPAPSLYVHAANHTVQRHAANGGAPACVSSLALTCELVCDCVPQTRTNEGFTVLAKLLVVEPVTIDSLLLRVLHLHLVEHVEVRHILLLFPYLACSSFNHSPDRWPQSLSTRLTVVSRLCTNSFIVTPVPR